MAKNRRQSAPYHHGDLRRALLEQVLQMVAERGDASELTLREVARRAGVSHAAPYRHFRDKEELLAALASEGFENLSRAMHDARLGADDPLRRFVCTGLAYLRFASEHRGYLALMHGPDVAKGRTPELQRAANDSFQVLKLLASDAGVTDEVEARRFGVLVWSFLYGLALLSGQKQIPPSVGASAEQLAAEGLARLFHRAS
jgi:AcrR family transcriptional regulator